MHPHRGEFATQVAADPEAVVCSQSFGPILLADGRHASSCERSRRFPGSVAARSKQCVAIGDVQPR